jgi:two-component system response regulator NreC
VPEPIIKTMVVDDHVVMRGGLRRLLEEQPDMQVVAEAADGLEAMEKARTYSPDVALVDITMPKLNGIDLIGLMKDVLPATKVVVLSMHAKQSYVRQVLKLGCLGYVLKASASSEILQAIRAAYRGEHYLCQELREEGLAAQRLLSEEEKPVTGYDLLTEREQQVFRLVAEGKYTKEIADLLCLSPKTIEKHRGSIALKLGIHGRMETLKYAIKIGLVDPDSWRD